MKSLSDCGLVLRRTRHLERDSRMVVFLREHGKFSLVLKGVARVESKLKTLQEPFSEIDIQVFVSLHGTHGRISGGRLMSSFERIRQSYEAYLVASACCEVVDMIVPFRAPSPEVYDILRGTFSQLETPRDVRESWIDFTQAVLKTLGHGDISEKIKDGPTEHRFNVASAELESILPWRMKSDLSLLRSSPVGTNT